MTRVRTPFLLALVVALVAAVGLALMPQPPHLGNVGDKWQHMAAFGTLTLLSVLAFPEASLLRIGERLSFLGALIEVFQSIPALHRDCDVMDWVADTFIIIVVLVIVRLLRGQRLVRRR